MDYPTKITMLPYLARLKQLYSYDASTGDIISHTTGYPIQNISGGYLAIRFANHTIKAHRLAWLLHYEQEPPNEIDHTNRDKTDNRLVNLRPATRGDNMRNRFIKNKSGLRGVHRSSSGQRWKSCIWVDSRLVWLGTWDCPYEAAWAHNYALLIVNADFAALNQLTDDQIPDGKTRIRCAAQVNSKLNRVPA